MILVIQNVLDRRKHCPDSHQARTTMKFVDGTATAGWHAKLVKKNLQVDRTQPDYAPLNKAVSRSDHAQSDLPHGRAPAARSRRCSSAAISTRWNTAPCRRSGDVQSAQRHLLHAFLADPKDYDGGELVMETTAGEQAFKPDIGNMIIYPSTVLHRVQPGDARRARRRRRLVSKPNPRRRTAARSSTTSTSPAAASSTRTARPASSTSSPKPTPTSPACGPTLEPSAPLDFILLMHGHVEAGAPSNHHKKQKQSDPLLRYFGGDPPFLPLLIRYPPLTCSYR